MLGPCSRPPLKNATLKVKAIGVPVSYLLAASKRRGIIYLHYTDYVVVPLPLPDTPRQHRGNSPKPAVSLQKNPIALGSKIGQLNAGRSAATAAAAAAITTRLTTRHSHLRLRLRLRRGTHRHRHRLSLSSRGRSTVMSVNAVSLEGP